MSKRILNQSSKSTSSKKRRNKRDIISTLPHREFPATTSTFSGLVITLLLGLFGVTNTYASSISVAISGEMNLNLLASDTGMFGTSSPTTISVVSSNSSGYTLTVLGDRSDRKLVGSNPNNYFTSITGSLTENEFNTIANNGKWGILPSKFNSETNTSYQQVPSNTAPVTVDTTNAANYTPNNYTLAVAARASTGAGSMTLADQYAGTFTIAATGNATDYDIAFVDYDAGMPGLMYGSSETGTATLPSTTPTKAGYEFAGWCSVPVTTGAACTGTTYAASGDYTLSSGDNNVTLYAIWDPITFDEAYAKAGKTDADKVSGHFKMQDMTSSICSVVAIGQEGTLVDNRANKKTYTVGKMKDGRCWMLDNLALGGSNTILLTSSDTNISANWSLPASSAPSTFSSSQTTARINTDYVNTVPTDTMSSAGDWKIGGYYNYCAAAAGTYCPAEGTVTETTPYDICPKGWRIPGGGVGGEQHLSYVAYGWNYSDYRNAMHLSLAGEINTNGQVNYQGSTVHVWSNSIMNSYFMYNLYANTYGVIVDNNSGRSNGFSMRCIAK